MSTSRELAMAAFKSLLAAIPIVGNLSAEVFGVLIPNRRMERLESLVVHLADQLDEVETTVLSERFRSLEFVDLLEEGAIQASRAMSDDRLHAIAALLKHSLTDEKIKHAQDKRLMQILKELNDSELLILASHSTKAKMEPEWLAEHDRIIYSPVAHEMSTQEEVDAATMHEQFLSNLRRLDLLQPRFRTKSRSEYPDLDPETGQLSVESYNPSQLGVLLLRRVGLLGLGEI